MAHAVLRRLLFALAAIPLVTVAAAAQSVNGQVLDQATGQPVPQATVAAVDQTGRVRARAQTDAGGRFLLLLDSAATVQLRGERIGYRAGGTDWLRVGASSSVSAQLRMAPSDVQLGGLTITARQTPPFRDRRARGFFVRAGQGNGHFILPETVEARRPGPLSGVLSDVPFLRFVGGRDGDVGTPVVHGNVDGCVPTIYVNGIVKRLVGEMRVNDLVDPSELWGVEVYDYAFEAPAELPAQDPLCGVIAIWTTRS
jgi:hypothetical protein